ncbi:hypothetical protein [Streptomyces sp. NPDC002215]
MPEPFKEYATGCCAMNSMAAEHLQAHLDQGGVPQLLETLDELRGTMLS